jgi:hypothetical protein
MHIQDMTRLRKCIAEAKANPSLQLASEILAAEDRLLSMVIKQVTRLIDHAQTVVKLTGTPEEKFRTAEQLYYALYY